MPFTQVDKIMIKNLFELIGYNAKQLVREFSNEGYNLGSIYKLLLKLPVTGSVDGSRWCSTHAAKILILLTNVRLVLHENG